MRALHLSWLALAACLSVSSADAQAPGPMPSGGTWMTVGERVCGGQTWAESEGENGTPVPRYCTPGSNGMTALCDNKTCLYKTVTPDECKGTGAPLKAYQCRAPALSPEAAKKADCSAVRTEPWSQAGKGYSITATVQGATCASATATFTVRRPDGTPIWSETVSVQWSLMFQDLKTPKDLDKVLAENLKDVHRFFSDELPEWKQGTERPSEKAQWNEERGVTREMWNAWRAAKRPMLIFAWGIEAQHFYLLEVDGRFRKIGFNVPG